MKKPKATIRLRSMQLMRRIRPKLAEIPAAVIPAAAARVAEIPAAAAIRVAAVIQAAAETRAAAAIRAVLTVPRGNRGAG